MKLFLVSIGVKHVLTDVYQFFWTESSSLDENRSWIPPVPVLIPVSYGSILLWSSTINSPHYICIHGTSPGSQSCKITQLNNRVPVLVVHLHFLRNENDTYQTASSYWDSLSWYISDRIWFAELPLSGTVQSSTHTRSCSPLVRLWSIIIIIVGALKHRDDWIIFIINQTSLFNQVISHPGECQCSGLLLVGIDRRAQYNC